jgi:agmatine deiminase
MLKDGIPDMCVNHHDVVFVTQALAWRYPEVYWPLKINLEANGIVVKTINRTRNIWIRDYFPVQVDGEFLRFNYSYGEKWLAKYPQLDLSNEPWTGHIAPIRYFPQIKLDGGNVVQGYNKVIMTDKVIKDNSTSVISQLEKILNAEVIIIPVEPGDSLGHSDGICQFVHPKRVIINDYSLVAEKDKRFIEYEKKLTKALDKSGLLYDHMPFGYAEWDWKMTEKQFRESFPEADDFNPAFGYYINFLLVGNVILMPAMRIPMDIEVMNYLKSIYTQCNIIAIDSQKLSMEGGLLHCITANYHITERRG